jgi:hypothetical protein
MFNYDWYVVFPNSIFHYFSICGYCIIVSDAVFCLIQYSMLCSIYLMLTKLIKDIINEDSDEYF